MVLAILQFYNIYLLSTFLWLQKHSHILQHHSAGLNPHPPNLCSTHTLNFRIGAQGAFLATARSLSPARQRDILFHSLLGDSPWLSP